MSIEYHADLAPEAAVLGAIMLRPSHMETAVRFLEPQMFSARRRVIWWVMTVLHERGEACEAVNVLRELRATDNVGEAGGPAELMRCGETPAVGYWIGHYIRDTLLTYRDWIEETSIYGSESADTHAEIDRVTMLADAAVADATGKASEPTLIREAVDSIDRPKLEPIATFGLMDIDKTLGGMFGGRLYVVGGRPSDGKSALLIAAATATAKRGRPVAFFSLEMPREDIGVRVLCGEAEVNTNATAWGDSDHAKMKAAAARLGRLPIHVEDCSTIDTISARARHHVALGVRLVVVDYLQLVRVAKQKRNTLRYEVVGEVTRELKRLAIELSVPVLVAAQLSRNIQGAPRLDDLRESGNIEQDADAVILIHFTDAGLASSTGEECPEATLSVAKNRHGPTGIAKAGFQKHTARWVNQSLRRE